MLIVIVPNYYFFPSISLVFFVYKNKFSAYFRVGHSSGLVCGGKGGVGEAMDNKTFDVSPNYTGGQGRKNNQIKNKVYVTFLIMVILKNTKINKNGKQNFYILIS